MTATEELTGPALVAKVATDICGYSIDQMIDGIYKYKNCDGATVTLYRWDPLTSMSDAWQVINRLVADGWTADITVYPSGVAGCIFMRDGRRCVGDGETLGEDILQAALMCVEEKS